MNPVRMIRLVVGWTQAQLAVAGGTSQPTIAAYETDRKSPTWRTISALADGAEVACYPYVGSPMTREQARSLALHAATARVVSSDPDRVLALARDNVARMHAVNPHARRLLDEWAYALELPARDLVARMIDPSDHGRELRQVSPFAGVLDAGERAEVYRAFRGAA